MKVGPAFALQFRPSTKPFGLAETELKTAIKTASAIAIENVAVAPVGDGS